MAAKKIVKPKIEPIKVVDVFKEIDDSFANLDLGGELTDEEKLQVYGPDYSETPTPNIKTSEGKLAAIVMLAEYQRGQALDVIRGTQGFAVIRELADKIVAEAQAACIDASPEKTPQRKRDALQARQFYAKEALDNLFARITELVEIPAPKPQEVQPD